MKIYRPDGKLWREVVALDSSFCEETLERFNRISLDFVLAEEILVPELCYVAWRGERYSLFSTPKVVKVSTREYRYTLNLEGRHLELDRVLVKDKLGRTKFVFTGRTDQYAELISDCLPSWKVGACTTGDATRVIAFNNTSLLEACRMVASKFETEVQLTDGAISFGRVERYKSDPLLLAYRNGLKKDITVEPDPKETAIGRLYVVGGDRNIDPAKYGGHQLHLLKNGKVSVGGHSFIADTEGRYISLEGDTRLNTSERAFDATSVYPKRVGTVSKVEKVGDEWDVLDDTNTIDYGQHRVEGDTMRLEFQSGRLAGRTFDLATKEDKMVGYVHSEKRFKLVRKEIDGVLMPEPTTFYPAVGDKYAIFGCSLPDEYITSAEGEMLLKGAEYMAERLEPRLQYRAELDGLWAKKNWGTVAHKLVVGTIVKLEGASSEVRISSVRTSLNSPYTPRITFSNAPYMVGSLATQIATLENAEVRQREELRAGLVKLQDRTYKDTEAVREMVEKLKVEGFSKSLKPETLQTMYAVIGSPALQFEFVGGGFSWSEGKGGAVTIPQQVIRQRVAGTTLEPDPKTVETTIPALTYTLKPDEQQAHIYVELKPTPRYVVSTKPLQITPDRLLIGLLNGAEGSRDFTPLYGFTEISPSHIATRYIRSRSGNMLIDLETGTIYSDKIEFRRPDGSTKSVEEVITDTVQVGGRNLAVMSRMVPGYLYGDHKRGNPGDVDYKVLQYGAFHYDPTYYPIEEGVSLVWVIKRKVVDKENPVVIIHWHNEQKELIRWDFGWWTHPEGTPRKLIAPKGTRYYRVGITHNPKDVQVMLERGIVATDWSPAPEDVQAEIDAINANPPRINQTTKNWEVYVPSEGKYVDTGRTSVGDDGKAPKIVDGYWYEWDSNTAQFTNTGIKAQGDKGDGLDIKDTRNDNQPPNWYRKNYPFTTVREFKWQHVIEIPSGWRDGSYCMLETTVKWADTSGGRITQKAVLNSGQELYRVGSADDSKWEAWSNIKAEMQEINAGLTNANTLIATLDKAQKQLEKGVLTKADTKDIQYLLDSLKNGKTQVAGGLVLTNDIILSDPNSKDVTAMISGTQTEGAKAMRLGIDYGGDKIAPLYDFIEPYGEKANQLKSLPSDEERVQLLEKWGYSVYRKSPQSVIYWHVYLTKEKKDIGEATAFNNNGTGHIGELFFNGNYIGFGDVLNSYMQVGGTARGESDMVNASTEMVTELMGATDASKSGRFSIRRLHSFTGFRDITLDLDLTLEAKARAARSKYGNDTGNLRPTDPKNPSGRYDDNYVFYESRRVTMRATIEVLHTRVDGVVVKTLKSEQVSVQAIAPGGSGEDLTRSPELLFGESELNKKVQFVIQSKDLRKGDGLEVFLVTERVGDNDYGCEGRASAKLVVTYPKDTSTPEVRITQDKTSFFYGRSRYMLLNYDDLIAKIVGDVLMQGNLAIKGTITADSYQGNGMPLAGATFNSSGGEVRALGRYKNRSGGSTASAGYDYSTRSFTVYHSIPHDRYIPLVNPFNDPASPVISDVSAYSFKVRFTLQSERGNGWAVGFSYIAFQAE